MPSVRRTLRATTRVCVVILMVGGYWTSVRETEVDEAGPPASSLSDQELSEQTGVAPGAVPLAPQP